MRSWLWSLVYSRLDPGLHLPPWALAIRAVLYPIEYLCWRQNRIFGYDALNHSFVVGGWQFPIRALHMLTKAEKGDRFVVSPYVTPYAKWVNIRFIDQSDDEEKLAQIRGLIDRFQSGQDDGRA